MSVAADHRFSNMIRERDGWTCQRCGLGFVPFEAPMLDAAHIFPKGSVPSLRFDAENAVALCRECHRWSHAHPAGWFEFIGKHLGLERFEALAARAHGRRDRS